MLQSKVRMKYYDLYIRYEHSKSEQRHSDLMWQYYVWQVGNTFNNKDIIKQSQNTFESKEKGTLCLQVTEQVQII